tara:strand:+ start:391 stop:627 length:237 start_codon:yes stop_codon:yes gene_type:complete
MIINVITKQQPPKRVTHCMKYAKWRSIFNNMNSGDWFVVSKKDRQRTAVAFRYHGYGNGGYTSYRHPHDTDSVVFVKS